MPINRTDPKGDAERIAIQTLTFLADDPARLTTFFRLTGMTPETLARDAADSSVHVALLDHLMGDESLLLTFAANSGIDPADIARARRMLEAGDSDNSI